MEEALQSWDEVAWEGWRSHEAMRREVHQPGIFHRGERDQDEVLGLLAGPGCGLLTALVSIVERRLVAMVAVGNVEGSVAQGR